MRFLASTQALAVLVAWSVWAWHVGAFGHSHLGVVGAIIGAMLSLPLMPVGPFAAWLIMDLGQAIWFYSSIVVAVVCAALQFFLRRRIYDESGREIG